MEWRKEVGIELRDLFAAHVASGLATYSDKEPDEIAACAYLVADAMMLERQKEK